MGNKTLYDLKISIDKLAYKCQVLTGIGHHPSEIALRSESYVKYLSAQFDGDKFKQAINNAVVTRPNIIEDIVTWGMPILSFLEDFKWVKYTKKKLSQKDGAFIGFRYFTVQDAVLFASFIYEMSVIYSFDINKKLETDKINLEFCTHRGNPAFRYKDNTQKQSVTLSLSALDAPQERCPLENMPDTTNTHTFESYLTSKAPEDLIDRLKNAKLKNKSAGAAITVMQELGYIIPIVSGERTKIYTALSILLGDIGDAKSVTAYINNRPLSSTDRDALLRLLESPQDL